MMLLNVIPDGRLRQKMERQLKYHQFKRAIGSTPGSVMVFADIPQDSEGKILKIKMQSPYEDYGIQYSPVTQKSGCYDKSV